MPVAGAPRREPGQRGGPLHALDAQLRWWLERADGQLDVRAVLLLRDECLEAAADDVAPAVVHADRILATCWSPTPV